MINRSDLDKILREYDELQLRSAKELQQRKSEIYVRIPLLKDLDSEIASQSVKCASLKIHGREREAFESQSLLKKLRMQRGLLLEDAGYSEASLKPRYICPECSDTGFTKGKMCTCMRKKITDVLYNQSNIRDVLAEENFETFSLGCYSDVPIPGTGLTPRQIAEKAAATARDFVVNFDISSDNLFITGATGTGKTFLSNCIAKELLDRGYFVFYLSAVRLFELLAEASFGNRGRHEAESDPDIIERQIFECDLLIIDDLGTEIVNTFTASRLFNCINERLLSRKHTIISTNLSLSGLQGNYSERIFSRIANNYIMIKLYGDDIRMKKKLEAL